MNICCKECIELDDVCEKCENRRSDCYEDNGEVSEESD